MTNLRQLSGQLLAFARLKFAIIDLFLYSFYVFSAEHINECPGVKVIAFLVKLHREMELVLEIQLQQT